MPVPYTFGTATTSIPLSNLDANFNTPVTIGNTTVGLGNTVTTIGNLTLTNATISTGNVTVTTGIFGAGSNTAPSITTTGDTNTGIFFPAADTIAFTEGGVESMRIDSAGRVGIGTSSPVTKLQVSGNTRIDGNIEANANPFVYSWSGGTTGQVRSGIQLDGTNTLMSFYTATNERMRIDSAGLVGIGCTPVANLQVNASSDVGVAMSNSSSVTSGNRGTISMFNSGNSGVGYIRFGAVTDNVGTDIQFGIRPVGGSVTEAMRIDSSGNVGINTSSPNGRVTIGANATDTALSGTSNTTGLHLYARAFGISQIDSLTNSTSNSGMSLRTYNNGTYTEFIANFQGNTTTFQTAGTERMRITSAGELLVGATSLSGARVMISATAAGGRTLYLNKGTGDTTDYFIVADTTTANRFLVLGSGDVQNTNNSYGAISDVKLKENIVDATPKLEDLCKVKVRNYNLKFDPDHKQIGVVAQELEQVFAGLVEETKDIDKDGNDLGTTTKSVKYSVFVPMLIKAIQEQQALIENLTTRLNALEGK